MLPVIKKHVFPVVTSIGKKEQKSRDKDPPKITKNVANWRKLRQIAPICAN